jgi:creatinine amidohydrolase
MSYSIFEGTMADMTYKDIERLVEEKAIVLLPVAVIEEHGPHLPLGTDTYLAYSIMKYVKDELDNLKVKSVLAPPFYYGINVATGGFPGSFTVKVATMKAVLKDTIECLYNWGVQGVYMLNLHGDYLHSKTLLEVAKEVSELGDESKKIYDIIPEGFAKTVGIKGDEAFVLIQSEEKSEEKNKKSENVQKAHEEKFFDIHAGGFETSLMLAEYKDLVNEELAKKLTSSKTTLELLRKWQKGGLDAKEVTPLGYCGDPSNINLDNALRFINDFAKNTAKLIKASLDKQSI